MFCEEENHGASVGGRNPLAILAAGSKGAAENGTECGDGTLKAGGGNSGKVGLSHKERFFICSQQMDGSNVGSKFQIRSAGGSARPSRKVGDAFVFGEKPLFNQDITKRFG
jgi:hypothetical protein